MQTPILTQPFTARTWAILPAAGAWDAAPLELAVPGYKTLTLFLSYERGDAAGAFDFQIQVSPYAADLGAGRDWFTQALYISGTLVAGADTDSNIQREYIIYEATGAGVESFVYGGVNLGVSVERLRVRCRESGVVADPGFVEIIALLGLEVSEE